MKDLIDRQAAIDAVNEYLRLSEVSKTVQNMTSIQAILRWLPTVDAVEVVRCRDCVYGEQDDIGRWYCRSLGCQVGDEDGSGFCADGERREDERSN